MDIYTSLKQDHDRVKDLMTQVVACGDDESPRRLELFEQMKQELLLHSRTEEQVFYDRLKQSSSISDKVQHGYEEHREAEKLMEELSGDSLNGAAWMQKFRTLKKAVEHHVSEEENEIFPAAEKVLDDSQEEKMAQWMQSGKEELRGSMRI